MAEHMAKSRWLHAGAARWVRSRRALLDGGRRDGPEHARAALRHGLLDRQSLAQAGAVRHRGPPAPAVRLRLRHIPRRLARPGPDEHRAGQLPLLLSHRRGCHRLLRRHRGGVPLSACFRGSTILGSVYRSRFISSASWREHRPSSTLIPGGPGSGVQSSCIEVIPDSAFDAEATADRNVVLWASAETNRAWRQLVASGPVQVYRDRVVVAERTIQGAEFACVFVRPRPGSDRASMGIVYGTGLAGSRLTERHPYFMAGAAYPEFTVLSPESLTSGLSSVAAVGYFRHDWSVEHGSSPGASRALSLPGTWKVSPRPLAKRGSSHWPWRQVRRALTAKGPDR